MSTTTGEGEPAFQEDLEVELQRRLEAWLATIPIGKGEGDKRSYNIADLLRFAKTWKLEKETPQAIYERYVNHQVRTCSTIVHVCRHLCILV